MRHTKILFPILAVAAMIALAVLGAAPASANSQSIVLCKVAELECAKANQYANPTTIVGHAVNPVLLTSIGNVECEKSLAELTLLNELSTLQIGHILALSFEGKCHLGNITCTITPGPLGLVSFTKTGPLTGNAESTGGTEVKVKCGFLMTCLYGGEPVLEVFSDGAGNLHMLANETPVTGKGICPEVKKWDANYLALGTYYVES